jgi:hypothetical protein
MFNNVILAILAYFIYDEYKKQNKNNLKLYSLIIIFLVILLNNKDIENFTDIWQWPKQSKDKSSDWQRAFNVCDSNMLEPCDQSNIRRSIYWISDIKNKKLPGSDKIKGIVFEPEGAGVWGLGIGSNTEERDEMTSYDAIKNIKDSIKDYGLNNLKIGITGFPAIMPNKDIDYVFPQWYNLTKRVSDRVLIDTGVIGVEKGFIETGQGTADPLPPDSIYRQNMNNPKGLVEAFKKLINTPSKPYPENYYAMFTVETDNKGGSCGLETVTPIKEGIVNGFGALNLKCNKGWTWTKFEEFLIKFGDSYKCKNFAIFQFNLLPTEWLDAKRSLSDEYRLGLWCEYPGVDAEQLKKKKCWDPKKKKEILKNLDYFYCKLFKFIQNKKIKDLVFRLIDPLEKNEYLPKNINSSFFSFLKDLEDANIDVNIHMLPWVSQKSGKGTECETMNCHPWNPKKYELTDVKAKQISDSFSINEDGNLCSKPEGKGACHEQIAPFGMYYDANGSVKPWDKCIEDCDGECKNGICITNENTQLLNKVNSLPRPKIGLYHGGVVGAPLSDPEVYKKYLNDVIRFVKDKRIDIVYIVLSPPIMDKEPYQFPYYQDPTWIAKNFLEKLPKGVDGGVVCYLRNKDANWDFQNSDYAKKHNLRSQMKGGHGETSCKAIDDKCVCDNLKLNTSEKGCPIRWNADCKPSCPECPDCSPDCIDQCEGNDLDEKKMKCFPECPEGCPNMAAQIMSYIGETNKASNGSKIKYFSFDGEDAGSSADMDQMCQLRHFAETLAPDVTNIGYAMSMQLAPNVPAGNFSLPETYWFMNELWPCTGSTSQWSDPNNHPECTILSSYRRFKDDPAGFLSFIEKSDQCGCSNGFQSLKENIKEFSKGNKNKDSGIWPMFSIENLSMSDGAPDCIARYWLNEYPENHKVCGTFDGFSFWQWDKFEQFLKIFAHKYGVKTVNIYESQFIPPHWMPGNKYSSNPNEGSKIVDSCNWQDVKCETDKQCTDYVNDSSNKCASSKIISNKGEYCRENGICHFDIAGKYDGKSDSHEDKYPDLTRCQRLGYDGGKNLKDCLAWVEEEGCVDDGTYYDESKKSCHIRAKDKNGQSDKKSDDHDKKSDDHDKKSDDHDKKSKVKSKCPEGSYCKGNGTCHGIDPPQYC